ncbi:hypothetical protein KEM48_003615 [Puccinia striiformis f. sp. tritici PST-130]|nr:hypothetical protein Pst134EB_014451 [Puccinia striiformis f. sp. tritici]KAI9614050.1 hypothetical protein KEM48_003615 [Puccinia striiformis f. sp. tritici PST-130]
MADSESNSQRHQQKGDLVIEVFKNLIEEYETDDELSSPTGIRSKPMSTKTIKSKKALLRKLETRLLPSLDQQIKSLPELSQSISDLHLDLILKSQSEFKNTLQEIGETKYWLCCRSCSPFESNDSGLEEIKSYRIYVLSCKIELDLMPTICQTFERYKELLEQRMIANSTGKSLPDQSYQKGSNRMEVVNLTSITSQEINATIELIQGSDFDNLQYRWPSRLSAIDSGLEEFLILIHEVENEPMDCPNSTQIDPSVKVAKSILVLIKLSRIFFQRISSVTSQINKEPHQQQQQQQQQQQCFSNLSSAQLSTLGELPKDFTAILQDILQPLQNSPMTEEESMIEELSTLIEEIKTSFTSGLDVVNQLAINMDYFRVWSETWKSSFDISIHNLTQISESYQYLDCQCSRCSSVGQS